QKLRALGLFLLLGTVSLFYLINDDVQVFYDTGQPLSGVLALIPAETLTFTYTLFSSLVLLFNLPTSSVFEQRSSEISSLRKITQAIQSNHEVEQIYSTLLDAAILCSDATAGWIEIVCTDGTSRIVELNGLTYDDAVYIQNGQSLVRQVIVSKKPLYFRNIQQTAGFEIKTRFRSLVGIPVISPQRELGALFLLKELSNAFDEETLNVLFSIADQAGIAIENSELLKKSIHLERYHEQIKIAKEIQEQLLPPPISDNPHFEFGVMIEEAEEVGGDYFDYWNQPGLYRILVADVSGKGTSAAFYLAEFKGIVQALLSLDLPMDVFLDQANIAASRCLSKETFITASFLWVNVLKHEVSYIRAGHCPMLYYHAQTHEVEIVNPKGIGLGILRGQQSITQFTTIWNNHYQTGDILLLFSDGIIEARNPYDEEFGIERLQQSLLNKVTFSAKDLVCQLLQTVQQFAHNRLNDDFTLLAIKFQ
ncbi:MAG: SpoIIE family protein phosphatase, partial [Bacteroidia bacterium]|nr:SpoIIE family protein phosphatase [Bacteroidia bacterium]